MSKKMTMLERELLKNRKIVESYALSDAPVRRSQAGAKSMTSTQESRVQKLVDQRMRAYQKHLKNRVVKKKKFPFVYAMAIMTAVLFVVMGFMK